ncbi:MAG: SPOR domain-containing protein [Bacteroidales bacterium]|nr:SPOR domain-containing protein [Bacteroidales bacterium]MDZ4205471.1 SPOR domain-containing protein [Bacteroidales bacterium]
MGIEKYLYELLFKHECVIVPGFGGFIKNYQAATIQAGTHIFSPPKQYLVFNAGLTINDGLLATHIASKEKLHFDEAMSLIERDVTTWRERMRVGKKITLLDIGTFHYNSEERVVFEPDRETNFFLDIYGMNSFVAPPVSSRAKRKHSAAAYSNRHIRKPAPATLKVFLKAAVITIPLIAAGLWATMNQDTIRQYARQSASIISHLFEVPANDATPTDKTATFQHQAAKPMLEDIVEESDLEYIAEITTEASAEEKSDEVRTINPSSLHSEPSMIPAKGYHVIIGSFSKSTNASHLSEQFITQGYNSSVIESAEGMYRVSLTSYPSYQEALSYLNNLRKQSHPDAWLLRL